MNERLIKVCNYTLNINEAQRDRELKAFFRPSSKGRMTGKRQFD
jgi:hypothetical protein